MSDRHPELTRLVARLRSEQPRPRRRWSELLAQVRANRPGTEPDRFAR